jgi:basic amino acid/polyamine antiporter, APA family
MATALVVGNMIGSGVFLLPASLAPLGWNAVIGWVLTIGGSLALAVVFARLSRAMPDGGPYDYVRAGVGTLPGFLVAWAYWISTLVTNAAIAVAAVSYASIFVPALSETPVLGGVFAVAILWLFTAISMLGARTAGGVQLVTTVIKIVPLVAVVAIAGLFVGDGRATLPPVVTTDLSPAAITAAASLTLWAMLGFESATVPAGKVIDPERTIPRATLWGTAVTGATYLFTCSAVSLLLPGPVATSDAPFATWVAHFIGGGAAQAMAVFAMIGALGALNGWILVQGEIPLALAKAGVFPAWFGVTNARGAPVRALIVSSLLATILVASNYSRTLNGLFVFMALFATVNTLFLYLLCSVAAIRLNLPKGLAVVGAIYSVWTFYGAGLEPTAWGLVALASGIPVYFAVRRTRASPRSFANAPR